MKLPQFVPACLAVFTLTLISGFVGLSAQAATWQTNASGNWNNTANWTTSNVPDTATETADFSQTPSAGPIVVTVNDTQYPGGLTTQRLSISNATSNLGIPATRFYEVRATGVSSVLNWTFGDVSNPGSLYTNRHQVTLDNVNANFLGTTSTDTITLFRLANLYPTQLWNLDANNSTIVLASAPVGTVANGLLVDTGGAMRMTGGSLQVTNSTNNAKVTVSNIDSTHSNVQSLMQLNATTFLTNQLVLSTQGIFTFNGAGASGSSDVTGLATLSGGSKAYLNSGTISFGSLEMTTTNTSLTNTIEVNGANVSVDTTILLKTGSNVSPGAPTPTNPDVLKVTAGSLSGASLEASGNSAGKGAFEVNVSGTGALTIAGEVQLGWDDSTARHGAGTLIISGGSVTANALTVGANFGADANSSGYYEQTGGTAQFSTIKLSRDNAGGSGYGTKEFVVGSGATLRVVGAGFSQVGLGNWLVDDTPSNLSFAGKLVFDPTAVTSQTYYAFGQEQGKLTQQGSALTAAIAANFGIGILDLTGLDGSEVLHVLPAGNFASNALYVSSIIGLTAAEAAAHLDSPINIYYDAAGSPELNGQLIHLLSGGDLIPLIAVPEPASLTMLLLGGCGWLARRRRAVRANA